MKREIVVRSQEELPEAAKELLDYCKYEKIFAIYGKMGAGKTTFIKALCKQLGSEDSFSSPTFSIVNEYAADKPIYHMDLYRVKDIQEAMDIGVEEYLFSGNYCFIEWPEVIEPVLPDETVNVKIETNATEIRTITIVK